MKYLIKISLFVTLLFPQFLSAQIDTGLVAYYPFSGNNFDVTNNNPAAISYGVEFVNDRFGEPNSAYYFDGNDYIDLGDILDDVFTGKNKQFSISLWFQVSDINYRQLISKSATTTCKEEQRQFTLWTIDNHFRFSYNCSPTLNDYWSLQAEKYLEISQWYHVVLMYDGTITSSGKDRVTIYINNQMITTKIIKSNGNLSYIKNGTAHLGIGNNLTSFGTSCSSNKFKGKIDDVRFYNRLLTTTDISEINTVNPVGIKEELLKLVNIRYLPNAKYELQFSTQEPRKFEVYSITGRNIAKTPISSNYSYELNLSGYPVGIYLLQITQNDKTFIKKLILR